MIFISSDYKNLLEKLQAVIFVGSRYKTYIEITCHGFKVPIVNTIYRNCREPTKTIVLVAELMPMQGAEAEGF